MRAQASSGQATDEGRRTAGQATLSLLTTHGNLTSYLTGGMIFPTGAHKPSWHRYRHHRDPGSLAPEFLPLFTRPPGDAVIGHLLDTTQFQNPVLIEIDASRLGPPAFRIDKAYHLRPGTLPPAEKDIAVLVNGLIPTSYVTGIIFRSDAERTDFQVRALGNFEPRDWERLYASDPERFGGDLNPTLLARALTEATGQGRPVLTSAADALGGAAARLAAVVESRHDLPLAPLVTGLNAIWSPDAAPAPGAAQTSPFVDAVQIIMPDGLAATGANPPESRASRQAVPPPFAAQLFTCALRRVLELDHGGIDRGSFVHGFGTSFPEQADLIDRYQRYVDNLSDDANLPPDTAPLVLGLLDFCRNLDPDNVEIGSDVPGEQAMATAILAGAYSGRGRLSAGQRPTHAPLLSRIDGLIALRANTIIGATHLTGSSVPSLAVKTDLAADPPREWIELRKKPLLKREHTPLPITPPPPVVEPEPEHEAEQTPAGDSEPAAKAPPPAPVADPLVAHEPQSPATEQATDLPATELPNGAPRDQLDWTNVSFSDPAIRRDVIALCQMMQWNHLVTTHLAVPEAAVTVAPRPEGGVLLTIPGLIPAGSLSHEIDHEAFLAIAPKTADALPEDTWRQLPALAAALNREFEGFEGASNDTSGTNTGQDENKTASDGSPTDEEGNGPQRGTTGTKRTKLLKADKQWLKDLLIREPRIELGTIKRELEAKDYALGNKAISNNITQLGFVPSSEGWLLVDQQPIQSSLISPDSATHPISAETV